MVIDGINYIYKAETTTEYLILTIEKELELNNWQYNEKRKYKKSK